MKKERCSMLYTELLKYMNVCCADESKMNFSFCAFNVSNQTMSQIVIPTQY